MGRLGPFEPNPGIAVAVSGGADSLALAALLQDWARARGGRVLALTVDHGLRPEAAAEARFVTRTLKPLGLEHRILRWRGPKPKSNVQAVARQARYDLLSRCCGRRGVLHLALGHHLDDQAETVLLRFGRGSGLDGLAAMASVVELPTLRLLRPLLAVSKARLTATLAARGMSWVEDPSNQDETQARARIRRLMPDLARDGLTAERLAGAARHLGCARAALELLVARTLVQAAAVHPAGFVRLDLTPLLEAPEDVGLRALARILVTVGGAEYPPRLERLRRLHGRLSASPLRAATLGGCRVLRHRGQVLVVRESRRLPEVPVRPGERLCWDGRFAVAIHRRAACGAGELVLGPLGTGGWAEIRGAVLRGRADLVPAPARAVLPALRDGRGVLAVPHLGFQRAAAAPSEVRICRFRPQNALVQSSFTVA